MWRDMMTSEWYVLSDNLRRSELSYNLIWMHIFIIKTADFCFGNRLYIVKEQRECYIQYIFIHLLICFSKHTCRVQFKFFSRFQSIVKLCIIISFDKYKILFFNQQIQNSSTTVLIVQQVECFMSRFKFNFYSTYFRRN